MPMRPPDFVADVTFLLSERGGKQTVPKQGYRCDIRYDVDPPGQAWMVWPRFLDANGSEFPDGVAIPQQAQANFYIVSDDARKTTHLGRLRVGERFVLVEGSRVVAWCTVKRLLSLAQNAA